MQREERIRADVAVAQRNLYCEVAPFENPLNHMWSTAPRTPPRRGFALPGPHDYLASQIHAARLWQSCCVTQGALRVMCDEYSLLRSLFLSYFQNL